MNITMKMNADVLEIALEGRLDTATAPKLEEAIKTYDKNFKSIASVKLNVACTSFESKLSRSNYIFKLHISGASVRCKILTLNILKLRFTCGNIDRNICCEGHIRHSYITC